MEEPPRLQIGVPSRDLEAPQHRLAGLRRGKRHQLAILCGRRDVVEPGHRACRLPERRVRRDVGDALAPDEHLAAVVERLEIVQARTHGCPSSMANPLSLQGGRRLPYFTAARRRVHGTRAAEERHSGDPFLVSAARTPLAQVSKPLLGGGPSVAYRNRRETLDPSWMA